LVLHQNLKQALYDQATSDHFLRLNECSLSWVEEWDTRKKKWRKVKGSRRGGCPVNYFCMTCPKKSLFRRILGFLGVA
jgi:hypothetical protein